MTAASFMDSHVVAGVESQEMCWVAAAFVFALVVNVDVGWWENAVVTSEGPGRTMCTNRDGVKHDQFDDPVAVLGGVSVPGPAFAWFSDGDL